MAQNLSKLIGITDACKILGKDWYPQLLRYYLVENKGPEYQRIGKHYFFQPEDVRAWSKPWPKKSKYE